MVSLKVRWKADIFRAIPEKELVIISTSQNVEETGLKSKNCKMIMQAICDHFSLNILGIVPDLKTYLTLEKDEDFEVVCMGMSYPFNFSNIYWTSKLWEPSPSASRTSQPNKKPRPCPNIFPIRTRPSASASLDASQSSHQSISALYWISSTRRSSNFYPISSPIMEDVVP